MMGTEPCSCFEALVWQHRPTTTSVRTGAPKKPLDMPNSHPSTRPSQATTGPLNLTPAMFSTATRLIASDSTTYPLSPSTSISSALRTTPPRSTAPTSSRN
eukprot:CAMPEP_0113663020 /NCGR_PEP_ID=MMETSP0038_2-20120614/904_1 /TAXON_ID=2898 /ORGANISM="Cryptomonas paramecium" /LENGTH=100 /DNA_ID=CAMNT_0000577989 /DNA_START=331 /DNA_END=630 /DNA_ORIENTATION=+ /assembly_acc=CAM_ASM_000170